MSFLWSAALKDLRRYRNDPLALLLCVGIPLVIGGLITLATGGSEGPRPKAHLLVVDEDDTFLSNLLVGAFGQDAASGIVRAEAVERDEGRRRIEDGDASALLVIPGGFAEAVLLEEPTELLMLTNPSQRILPGILEEGLSILVDGVFYAHRILGDELRELAEGPPGGATTFADADMARISVSFNQIARRLEKYLFPPVIELDVVVEEDEEEGVDVSYSLLFLPGVLLMALFFTTQGLSEDIWKEREQGTLSRVVSSPQSIVVFLGGKLVAGAAMLAVICFAGLLVGMVYHGVALTLLPLALFWAVFSGVVLLLFMVLAQLLASSRKGGAVLTGSLMFPLLMVGGSFFPFEAMPEWMSVVGRHTPNGWALENLKDILLERADPGSLAGSFVSLVLVGAALLSLCAWRMRRVSSAR